MAAPLAAQDSEVMAPEIVVNGQRLPGLRPLRSLDSDELRSFGAGTISDLLGELASESGDRSENITILIDGKRVPGLGDVESLPAEVLARIDILPRETGAKVGAPAGSRVYNIVLKPETRIGVARGRFRTATDGGASGTTTDLSATRIRRPQRLNAALQLRREKRLLESEREIVQQVGAPGDLGRLRTLRPGSSGAEITISAADQLTERLDGLITLKLADTRSEARLGQTGGPAVERFSRSRAFDLAGQLAAEVGSWQVALDASHRRDRRLTDTGPAGLALRTSVRTRATAIDLLAHGPLLRVPAGIVHFNMGASFRGDRFGGRGFDGRSTSFGRRSGEGRLGIDVPILGGSMAGGSFGELALRAEVRAGSADGAGRQRARSLSLRWAPASWLQLTASDNRSRNPPGSDVIGEPVIETAGVRVFDPIRGETVDVVALTGGLPNLPTQKLRMQKLAADLRPLRGTDLLLTAEYQSMQAEDLLGALPPPSERVTGLFPGRFIRDAGGRLTRVDLRPVVLAAMRERRLQLGTALNLPLKRVATTARLQLAGSYGLLLSSRLEPGSGGDTIDLLGRDNLGFGGMRPRQQFDVSLGYSGRGLGVRLTGERRSRSFLGVGDEAGDLEFKPVTSFSLRAFVEGTRIAPGSALFGGTRFGLNLANLANSRERVLDGAGLTPLAFQPALRDPLGRLIELEVRKSF